MLGEVSQDGSSKFPGALRSLRVPWFQEKLPSSLQRRPEIVPLSTMDVPLAPLGDAPWNVAVARVAVTTAG
jgi:hypothetical protein